MQLVYYLQEGIMKNSLPKEYEKFYIEEDLDSTSSVDRYFFPGDDIQYALDDLCVKLYDVFQNVIFSSHEEYYKDYGVQPQWISRAGLDSDFDMPKDELVECFSVPLQDKMANIGIKDQTLLQIYQEIELKKYKYAYTADCQSLVNTLQELIMGIHSSFVGFYKHLCMLHNIPKMEGTYYECSTEARMVYSFLYSFIIQSYSTFDILTKIAYELENIKIDTNSYVKMASSKLLYGDKKKLNLDVTGTIFEKSRTVSVIENLRNEIVHNATWEMNPKVFISTNNKEIVARFILLPDFTPEGTLVTFKNRKRFFSEGKKVNEELPKLYFDVLQKIYKTLKRLIN